MDLECHDSVPRQFPGQEQEVLDSSQFNGWIQLERKLEEYPIRKILSQYMQHGYTVDSYEGCDAEVLKECTGAAYSVFAKDVEKYNEPVAATYVPMDELPYTTSYDGSRLYSFSSSTPQWFRDVYVLKPQSVPIEEVNYALVMWSRNDLGILHTKCSGLMAADQALEYLQMEGRPFLQQWPKPMFNLPQFANYNFLLDQSLFSWSDSSKDGAQWNARSTDERGRQRSVCRSHVLMDNKKLRIMYSAHISLRLLRMKCAIFSGTEICSPVMIQYLALEPLDISCFARRTRNNNLPLPEKEAICKAYSNRTAAQARDELHKQGFTNLSLKQIQNQKKNVLTALKDRVGRRPRVTTASVTDAFFSQAKDTRIILEKTESGAPVGLHMHVISSALLLFLTQATRKEDLESHRRKLNELHTLRTRREKNAFIKSNFLKDQDSSGHLHSATILSCDTTFNLSDWYITIIMGSVRGYVTRAGSDQGLWRTRWVAMSIMAHSRKSQFAHTEHMKYFQECIDNVLKSNPKLNDRVVTAFLTDGEAALCVYNELSICRNSAQHLGCAFHVQRLIIRDGVDEKKMQLIFGKSSNGTLEGGLLSALDKDEFDKYMDLLEPEFDEEEFSMIESRAESLFYALSMGNKLKGCIVSQYFCNNHIESFNSVLKRKITAADSPCKIISAIKEIILDDLNEFTKAATVGSDKIFCYNALKDYNVISDKQRNNVLKQMGLPQLVIPDLATLHPSFLEKITHDVLATAFNEYRNKKVSVCKGSLEGEEGVFVMRADSKGLAQFVTIERKSFDDGTPDAVTLGCKMHYCKQKQFCEHKLATLMYLPLADKQNIARTHCNRDVDVVDDEFRRCHRPYDGRKGGRKGKMISKGKHSRRIDDLKEKTILEMNRKNQLQEMMNPNDIVQEDDGVTSDPATCPKVLYEHAVMETYYEDADDSPSNVGPIDWDKNLVRSHTPAEVQRINETSRDVIDGSFNTRDESYNPNRHRQRHEREQYFEFDSNQSYFFLSNSEREEELIKERKANEKEREETILTLDPACDSGKKTYIELKSTLESRVNRNLLQGPGTSDQNDASYWRNSFGMGNNTLEEFQYASGKQFDESLNHNHSSPTAKPRGKQKEQKSKLQFGLPSSTEGEIAAENGNLKKSARSSKPLPKKRGRPKKEQASSMKSPKPVKVGRIAKHRSKGKTPPRTNACQKSGQPKKSSTPNRSANKGADKRNTPRLDIFKSPNITGHGISTRRKKK